MVPADRLEGVHPAKRIRMSPATDISQTEAGEVSGEAQKGEELKSPNSTLRESSRLRNRASLSAKAKQDSLKAQQDSGNQPSLLHPQWRPNSTGDRSADDPQKEAVMAAARAAQKVKHACTIDENELVALRPTLLRGYASICNQERDASLEADLKSLLYYFRHHTVEPEVLKRLCFVEIVYSLQNHANRLVADLAAQLIALGPWKVVYDQLCLLNPPWFEQHAIRSPEQPAGPGVPVPSGAVPVAAAMQRQVSGL
ncbi:hypothetical protein ABBQ38_012077 [Trebouxia sp. C0009 RCD-2024]